MSTGAFPRFVELPPEIRLKIWQFWMSPRLVSFYSVPSRVKSSIPLALLGVNKESNFEMSLFYQESFGYTHFTGDDPVNRAKEERKGVRFHADIDTLLIYKSTAEELAKYCTNGLDRLRYIAVLAFGRADGGTLITSIFPALGRLFIKCEDIQRLYLCLIDPFGRAINEQDELRRRAFERSLENYWDWYTFEGKEDLQMSPEDAQVRWRDVVRVMYMSQLKEERGIPSDHAGSDGGIRLF